MRFSTLSVVLLPFLLASSVQAYPVTSDTLNCRSGPTTNDTIIKTYQRGAYIDIKCQITGTRVETTTVWDLTQDDCYVSDYYVSTGHPSYIPGVPKCGEPTPPPTGFPCTGLNPLTLDLIKEFEGFEPTPAPDPIGLPTVGYGHLCQTSDCNEAGPFPLTEETAVVLLLRDLRTYMNCIAFQIVDTVVLSDNQFGALTSWAYNMGCGATGTSTLVERINNGEDMVRVVEEELPKWNQAGDPPVVFPGLTRRRLAEVELFKTPSERQAHPNCT